MVYVIINDLFHINNDKFTFGGLHCNTFVPPNNMFVSGSVWKSGNRYVLLCLFPLYGYIMID